MYFAGPFVDFDQVSEAFTGIPIGTAKFYQNGVEMTEQLASRGLPTIAD